MINIKNNIIEHQHAEKNTTESDLDYIKDTDIYQKQRKSIETTN